MCRTHIQRATKCYQGMSQENGETNMMIPFTRFPFYPYEAKETLLKPLTVTLWGLRESVQLASFPFALSVVSTYAYGLYIHTYACTHTYIYIYTDIWMCKNVCVHAHIYTYTYKSLTMERNIPDGSICSRSIVTFISFLYFVHFLQ